MRQETFIDSLDILNLHEEYKKKNLSPVEVTKYLLEKIKLNASLNIFITVCEKEAIQQAKEAENLFLKGCNHSKLLGIPIGLKDLIYTKGIRTTMASGVYQHFIPNQNATIVNNLRKFGSIILGKQNLHELAYGTTGDISYFGPTRNPYHPGKIAGGSSSGSAAAVAANLCLGSVGTDTSGSIRIPASLCGVVGFKPTINKIDMTGVYPLSYSMDHIGPITKTVIDNAILFDGLCGTLQTKNALNESLINLYSSDFAQIRIGIPEHHYYSDLDAEVENNIKNTIELLKDLGAPVKKINLDIPDLSELMEISNVIDQTESYLINQKIINNKELGMETRKRILRGAGYRAYEYLIAKETKREITAKLRLIFNDVDVLLTPTVPFLPTDIGVETVKINNKIENVRKGLMKFTFLSNYIGLPSISIPCGMSKDNLPIGLQLIGFIDQDKVVFEIAYLIERALN